jgi:hypothetical protein
MAIAPIVTVETAIETVLGHLHLIDDGVTDPLLVADILASLNAAQEQLNVTAQHLRQRRQSRVTPVAGVRLFDLPSDARYGDVKQVLHVSAAGTKTELLPGIDRTKIASAGIPERFDVVPSTGIISVTVTAGGTGSATDGAIAVSGGSRDTDGSDPVLAQVTADGVITSGTVTQTGAGWITAPTLTESSGTAVTLTAVLGPVIALEVYPVPSDGTLFLDYTAGIYPLVNDSDVLSINAHAVCTLAAWAVSTVRKPSLSPSLLAMHNAFIQAHSTQQRPGQVFSLKRNFPTISNDPLARYAR